MVRAHNASAKLCNSIVLAKFFAKKIALLLDFPLFFNLFSRVEADIGRMYAWVFSGGVPTSDSFGRS